MRNVLSPDRLVSLRAALVSRNLSHLATHDLLDRCLTVGASSCEPLDEVAGDAGLSALGPAGGVAGPVQILGDVTSIFWPERWQWTLVVTAQS